MLCCSPPSLFPLTHLCGNVRAGSVGQFPAAVGTVDMWSHTAHMTIPSRGGLLPTPPPAPPAYSHLSASPGQHYPSPSAAARLPTHAHGCGNGSIDYQAMGIGMAVGGGGGGGSPSLYSSGRGLVSGASAPPFAAPKAPSLQQQYAMNPFSATSRQRPAPLLQQTGPPRSPMHTLHSHHAMNRQLSAGGATAAEVDFTVCLCYRLHSLLGHSCLSE